MEVTFSCVGRWTFDHCVSILGCPARISSHYSLLELFRSQNNDSNFKFKFENIFEDICEMPFTWFKLFDFFIYCRTKQNCKFGDWTLVIDVRFLEHLHSKITIWAAVGCMLRTIADLKDFTFIDIYKYWVFWTWSFRAMMPIPKRLGWPSSVTSAPAHNATLGSFNLLIEWLRTCCLRNQCQQYWKYKFKY